MIKTKVAATSRKRHTTRGEILGVFNHRNVQLAFYDTPGFVRGIEASGNTMKELRGISVSAAKRADVILLVVDASKNQSFNEDTFAEMVRIALDNSKVEFILVLNKVDLINPKSKLLDITRRLVSLINGVKLGPGNAHLASLDTTTFMISALKNDGVIDMKNYLISLAQPKGWVLPKSKGATDLSPEARVEEIVLEMMLDQTHQEIPYESEISCVSIKDLNPIRIRIDVEIKIDTVSQRRIIVGQQGRTLVKVRQASVEVLETIFKKEVILFLWVLLRDENYEDKMRSLMEETKAYKKEDSSHTSKVESTGQTKIAKERK